MTYTCETIAIVKIINIFTIWKVSFCLCNVSFHLPFLSPGNHWSGFRHKFALTEFYIKRLIYYDLFCFTLSHRFLHVVCINSFFLLISDWYSIVWLYHNLFLHSPIEHFGFPVLSYYKHSCYDIHVKVWYRPMYSFLLWKHLGVEWLGGMVGAIMFLRNCQIIFQGGCAILQSLKKCIRSIASPHPYSSIHLWSVFIILAIPRSV